MPNPHPQSHVQTERWYSPHMKESMDEGRRGFFKRAGRLAAGALAASTLPNTAEAQPNPAADLEQKKREVRATAKALLLNPAGNTETARDVVGSPTYFADTWNSIFSDSGRRERRSVIDFEPNQQGADGPMLAGTITLDRELGGGTITMWFRKLGKEYPFIEIDYRVFNESAESLKGQRGRDVSHFGLEWNKARDAGAILDGYVRGVQVLPTGLGIDAQNFAIGNEDQEDYYAILGHSSMIEKKTAPDHSAPRTKHERDAWIAEGRAYEQRLPRKERLAPRGKNYRSFFSMYEEAVKWHREGKESLPLDHNAFASLVTNTLLWTKLSSNRKYRE